MITQKTTFWPTYQPKTYEEYHNGNIIIREGYYPNGNKLYIIKYNSENIKEKYRYFNNGNIKSFRKYINGELTKHIECHDFDPIIILTKTLKLYNNGHLFSYAEFNINGYKTYELANDGYTHGKHWEEFIYDNVGCLLNRNNSNGYWETRTYDDAGRNISYTDSKGNHIGWVWYLHQVNLDGNIGKVVYKRNYQYNHLTHKDIDAHKDESIKPYKVYNRY